MPLFVSIAFGIFLGKFIEDTAVFLVRWYIVHQSRPRMYEQKGVKNG